MKASITLTFLVSTALALAGCSRTNDIAPLTLDFEIPRTGPGLEIRVLANELDDKEAIEEILTTLNEATPETKAELEDLRNKGLPPPGPREGGPGDNRKTFVISLPGKSKTKVTYSWLEVGPLARLSWALDSSAKEDDQRNEGWKRLAQARDQAILLKTSGKKQAPPGLLF